MHASASAGQLEAIFHNEHYTAMRLAEKKRDAWQGFLKRASVAVLVQKARDLHEQIHTATRGVYRFTRGMSIRQVGVQIEVDPTGKSGFPLSWHLDASPSLVNALTISSEVEMEIWRRIAVQRKVPHLPLSVFQRSYAPDVVRTVFSIHHRDTLNTMNGMPCVVESAFYHLPHCPEKFTVTGFRYPHPVSKIQYAHAG